MLQAVWGVVRNSKIELLEPLDLPEGAKVIITVLAEEETDSEFWLNASGSNLDKIWNNENEDIYVRQGEDAEFTDPPR